MFQVLFIVIWAIAALSTPVAEDAQRASNDALRKPSASGSLGRLQKLMTFNSVNLDNAPESEELQQQQDSWEWTGTIKGNGTFTGHSNGDGEVLLSAAWQPNQSYRRYQCVSYQGKNYMCIQSHTSTETWTPAEAPILWELHPQCTGDNNAPSTTAPTASPTSAPTSSPSSSPSAASVSWTVNQTYTRYQCVTYQGQNYMCLQDHVSQPAWNPANSPSLWQPNSDCTGAQAPSTSAPSPTTEAPTDAPTTEAPTASPTESTSAPTQAPTASPTSNPLACQSSPPSTCAIDLPDNLTMYSGEAETFTFTFLNNCQINSYRVTSTASSPDISATDRRDGSNIDVTVQSSEVLAGTITLQLEWCDQDNNFGSIAPNIVLEETQTGQDNNGGSDNNGGGAIPPPQEFNTTLPPTGNASSPNPPDCRNGPRSTCLIGGIPIGLLMRRWNLPACAQSITSYSIQWNASTGVNVMGQIENGVLMIMLDNTTDLNGTLDIYADFCDETGYGQFNISVNVTSTSDDNGTVSGNLTSRQPLDCLPSNNSTGNNSTSNNSTQNMTYSACTIDFPNNLTIGSWERKHNITLVIPCLSDISSFSLQYNATSGINITANQLNETAFLFMLENEFNGNGSFNFSMEWCDSTGYGLFNTSVNITPGLISTGAYQGNISSDSPLACSQNQTNTNTSNCTFDFPSFFNVSSWESTRNFTLLIPDCLMNSNVTSYSILYNISEGINLTAISLNESAVLIMLEMEKNNSGSVNVSMEWCDNNGYGQFNYSFNITAAFLVTGPMQGNFTSAQPLDCQNSSNLSTCQIILPQTVTLTSGESSEYSIAIPECALNLTKYNLTWNAPIGINVSALSVDGQSVLVRVETDENANGSFNFSIEWCDENGYGSANSTIIVTPGTGGNNNNGNTGIPPETTTTAPETTTAAPETTTAAPETTTAAPETTTTTTTAPETTTVAPTESPSLPSGTFSSSSPVTCQNGPSSSCPITLPTGLSMCSCERSKTFSFTLPLCALSISAYNAVWSASSNGIQVNAAQNLATIDVTVNTEEVVTGTVAFSLEWCDITGHGSSSTSITIYPNTSTTTAPTSAAPTQAPVTQAPVTQAPVTQAPPTTQAPATTQGPATTQAPPTAQPDIQGQQIVVTQGCSATGTLSTCQAIAPDTVTAVSGTDYIFTAGLSCPFNSINTDWAVSTDRCQVTVNFDSQRNPSYTIRCNGLTTVATGIIKTIWCDNRGGYISHSTTFTVNPLPGSGTTAPTPTPSIGVPGERCGKNGPQSSCHVSGPTQIAVLPATPQSFTLTLDCPASYVQSSWWTTFATALVRVNYDDLSNPVYTISAPAGSQGRGGYIVTEWCDSNGGYINYTTNFAVQGTLPTVQLRATARSGQMMEGHDQSAEPPAAAGVENDSESTTTETTDSTTSSSTYLTTQGAGMVAGIILFGVLLTGLVCAVFYCCGRKHIEEKETHELPEIRDEEAGIPAPSSRDINDPALNRSSSLGEREY